MYHENQVQVCKFCGSVRIFKKKRYGERRGRRQAVYMGVYYHCMKCGQDSEAVGLRDRVKPSK